MKFSLIRKSKIVGFKIKVMEFLFTSLPFRLGYTHTAVVTSPLCSCFKVKPEQFNCCALSRSYSSSLPSKIRLAPSRSTKSKSQSKMNALFLSLFNYTTKSVESDEIFFNSLKKRVRDSLHISKRNSIIPPTRVAFKQ